MIDAITDALLDTAKLLPFLFAAFLLLEFIEHKLSEKTQQTIKNAGKLGPFFGSVLGAFPQCGFSAMASEFYSTRVITLGTLIAVYLSTSDEMLLIMLSRPEFITKGLIITAIKVVIGMVAGFIIDLICRRFAKKEHEHIHDMCETEHCHCEHGIFRSALNHTAKIALFVLIVTLAINISLEFLGSDALSKLFLKNSVFSPFIASLVGLIPNCAASVAITELYLSNAITLGAALSGLLTSCGVGLLLLFRFNRPMKQNVIILSIIYAVGVFSGIIVDALGIVL